MNSKDFFYKMIDDLVEFSEHDPELKEGVKWLDEQAFKKGISFYDMVYEVMSKHDINNNAKDWLRSKGDNKHE